MDFLLLTYLCVNPLPFVDMISYNFLVNYICIDCLKWNQLGFYHIHRATRLQDFRHFKKFDYTVDQIFVSP